MVGLSSVYFNNFASSGEQNLLTDLIIESISIYGQDMVYVPRQIVKFDKVIGADDVSQYTTNYQVCMYIHSVDGFGGDGNFMSKFGVEIRDQVTFVVAQRTFNEVIGVESNQPRPNEGDLIFFPLNQKCFQIKYVDKFSMFYPLGTLPTWKMTCELFEYSDEIINTGIAAIDILQQEFSTNILDYALLDQQFNYLTDQSNNYLVTEQYIIETIDPEADNTDILQGSNNFANGVNSFISFNTEDPFGEGNTF